MPSHLYCLGVPIASLWNDSMPLFHSHRRLDTKDRIVDKPGLWWKAMALGEVKGSWTHRLGTFADGRLPPQRYEYDDGFTGIDLFDPVGWRSTALLPPLPRSASFAVRTLLASGGSPNGACVLESCDPS